MSRPIGILGLDVVPLEAAHDVDSFDCGSGLLNTYLSRYALAEQKSAKVRIYVLIEGTRVIGYYSVGAGVVEAALSRSYRSSPAPAGDPVVVARMAVDCRRQRHGIGGALLRQLGGESAGLPAPRQVIGGDRSRSALIPEHRL